MNDQISSLMDGELQPESAQHLFTAIESGGQMRECWSTYHLIGDVMRGNPIFQPDFQQRVMQQLDNEPTTLAPQAKKRSINMPNVWSIAASITAVMFVGWMVLQQQGQSAHGIVPVEIAQNLPAEYLAAHQSLAPSSAAYYVQPASYSESAK